MAISFSRPDPASPASVGSAGFTQSRRGYDPGEVRDFLRMVAAELARLQERERFLESELRAMQTRGMSAPGRLDEETVTTLLGEEAARVLAAARDASTQIRDRAEESATRMVKEAAEDANRIRESAMLDAQRIREEAAGDAEAEIELAKQQGRDMVVEAREYREKVLTELARRRDAARAQIDKLIQDRERLLTAFGRAKASSEEALVTLADAHDEPETFLAPPAERPRINPNHPSVTIGIYDRATEDLDDDVVAAPRPVPTVGAPRSERMPGPVPPSVDDDRVEAETSIEVQVEISDEIGQSEVWEEGCIPILDDSSTTAEDEDTANREDVAKRVDTTESETTAQPADGLAKVVELFGGDRRPTVRPVRDGDVADTEISSDIGPADDAAPVDSVVPAGDVVSASDAEMVEDAAPADDEAARKVDDIFARLRGATVESVSVAAAETVATPDVTETPDMASDATVTDASPVSVSDPAVFAERDAALGPISESLVRHLRRALMDEQNSVLEHLAQRRSSLDPDAVVGASEAREESFMAAIRGDLMAAATAGAKSMKPHGGSTKRVTPGPLEAAIVTVLHDRVLGPIRSAVEESVAGADADRSRIAESLRGLFREWKSRADLAADDLARSAHACGALLSLESGTPIRWMTTPDGDVCADCADNTLAGVVRSGEAFPTGDLHPGAHPGCRCLLGPAHH